MTTVEWGRFQATMPAGLTIDCELHGAAAFGRVFLVRDERFSAEYSVWRVVRLLENAAWIKKVQERAAALLNLRLPHVCTPTEAGTSANGGLYLIENRYDHCLAGLVQAHEGLPPATTGKIVGQLLTGLAALHQKGISHGDFRLKNVFLNGSGVNDPAAVVFIGDTAIGGLTFWSGNKLLDEDSIGYLPPEWAGEVQEPSRKADLYALGLVVCQLLLGKRLEPHGKSSMWVQTEPKLQGRGVDRSLQELIRLLLAAESDRPVDGAETLKRFEKFQLHQANSFWRLAAMLFATLAILSVTMWGWTKFSSGMVIRDLHAKLAQSSRKPDLPSPIPETPKSKDLDAAARQWNDWASDPLRKWESLPDLIKGSELSDTSKKILDGWRTSILERSTKKWRLRLIRGTAVAGFYTRRVVNIYSNDQLAGKLDHPWDSETEHNYTKEPNSVDFDWEPGQSIQILCEGDSYGSVLGHFPDIVDATFPGPLAIWQLHKTGKISSADGTLEFEIVDCPGPPRDQFKQPEELLK